MVYTHHPLADTFIVLGPLITLLDPLPRSHVFLFWTRLQTTHNPTTPSIRLGILRVLTIRVKPRARIRPGPCLMVLQVDPTSTRSPLDTPPLKKAKDALAWLIVTRRWMASMTGIAGVQLRCLVMG